MSHPVTDTTFEQEVLQAPGPALVDVWADTIGAQPKSALERALGLAA